MGNIWLSIFVESNWLVCFHRLQPEEMTRLRSLNRQLQIDIDCTLKETDLLQSRGMQTHTHKCTFLQIKLWSVSLIYFKALILKEPRPEADRLGSKVMDESPSHCIQMQRSKTTGRSITGPVTGLTLIGPLHSVWLVLVNYVIANSIACLNKLHCFTYFPGIVFFECEQFACNLPSATEHLGRGPPGKFLEHCSSLFQSSNTSQDSMYASCFKHWLCLCYSSWIHECCSTWAPLFWAFECWFSLISALLTLSV